MASSRQTTVHKQLNCCKTTTIRQYSPDQFYVLFVDKGYIVLVLLSLMWAKRKELKYMT